MKHCHTFVDLPWLSLQWFPQAPGVFSVSVGLRARPFRLSGNVGALCWEIGEPWEKS